MYYIYVIYNNIYCGGHIIQFTADLIKKISLVLTGNTFFKKELGILRFIS